MGPVEPFGLVGVGQAEERDHDGGASGQRDRLGGELVVDGGSADAEPGREYHPDAVWYRGLEFVHGVVDLGGVHLGTAGALIAGSAGELADHRNRVAIGRLQGQ